jgi:hypothetical protein
VAFFYGGVANFLFSKCVSPPKKVEKHCLKDTSRINISLTDLILLNQYTLQFHLSISKSKEYNLCNRVILSSRKTNKFVLMRPNNDLQRNVLVKAKTVCQFLWLCFWTLTSVFFPVYFFVLF